MKALCLAIIACIFSEAFGSSRSEPLTRFIAIRVDNCEQVFYVPRVYAIDERQSYILPESSGSEGGIHLSIVLKAKVATPDQQDLAELENFSKEDPDCLNGHPEIAPYPAELQALDFGKIMLWKGFKSIATMTRTDFEKQIDITIDPKKTTMPELIANLKYLSPYQVLKIYHLETEASVSVSADYAVAANFMLLHYTEKVCHEVQRCQRIAFWEKCKSESWCDDIPKVTQYLQDAEIKRRLGYVEAKFSPTFPEEELAKMREKLMSRMAMSLFVRSMPMVANAVTTVTLGELSKQVSARYEDQINAQNFKTRPFYDLLDVSGFDHWAKPILQSLFRGDFR